MSTASGPPDVVRGVAVTGLVCAAGVTFNILRLAVGLDHGSLRASALAFLGLAVAALGAARLAHLSPAALGIRVPLWGRALAGGAWVAALLVVAAVATGPALVLPTTAQLAGGIVLFTFCIAPSEELLFRGVLFAALVRSGGPAVAVLGSAAAFAVAHSPVYGLESIPVAFAAGLLLGWLRWWSRSLASPIVVHGLADLALLWL